jgi:spore maturation protein CgeB
LILCKKDNWNIIEKWFEPNKEFLYFENEIDLENLITEILKNYDKYQIIINNAYNKAINNYTTRHFVEKYLK